MRIFLGVMLFATAAQAQTEQFLTVPESSLEASVEQTVGITKLTVKYHRPAVAGRKVWGELVPYGEVWRAGANENTTLTASTPVKIGGKTLPAGTYGVHILPTDKQWTVILSNFSGAWGSFGYDAKDDAVRVQVTPVADAMEERLSYRFDDPTETSTILTLRWEKVRVALKIEVDTVGLTMAHMRHELRGAHQFSASAWEQAAAYWLKNGGNLDEATTFAERALTRRPTYKALLTRAAIADRKGDAKTAATMRAQADALATEQDFNARGYELMQEKKLDDAIAVFTKNVQAHPQSWNAHDSLAEAYFVKGDKAQAQHNYRKALGLVKDEAHKKRIEQMIARLSKSS